MTSLEAMETHIVSQKSLHFFTHQKKQGGGGGEIAVRIRLRTDSTKAWGHLLSCHQFREVERAEKIGRVSEMLNMRENIGMCLPFLDQVSLKVFNAANTEHLPCAAERYRECAGRKHSFCPQGLDNLTIAFAFQDFIVTKTHFPYFLQLGPLICFGLSLFLPQVSPDIWRVVDFIFYFKPLTSDFPGEDKTA